jgi:hypothetical protein
MGGMPDKSWKIIEFLPIDAPITAKGMRKYFQNLSDEGLTES